MLNSSFIHSFIHGYNRNLLTRSNHFATHLTRLFFLYVIPKAEENFPVTRSDAPPRPPPSSAQADVLTVTEDAANVSNCSHLFHRSCQYLFSPAAEIGPVGQRPRSHRTPPRPPLPPPLICQSAGLTAVIHMRGAAAAAALLRNKVPHRGLLAPYFFGGGCNA